MDTPVLWVKNLSKSYGEVSALRGVDLCVHAGEWVALLGPNGAGKTTLLQLLTGLFAPDSGEIRVFGYDMRREAHRALAAIGVVFQQPSIDLDLSVRVNLWLHAAIHGIAFPQACRRIAALLGDFGLSAWARRPVRALSGGNRRKVELIRAFLPQPRLLIMDEATVGLDPSSRMALLEAVQRWRCETQGAVLWATHLVDEAERADRVVILNQGQILADATPQALMATGSLTEAFLDVTAERS